MEQNFATTFFAPQLHIRSGLMDADFYVNGLGASELRRWTNDDGSIHVAELSINGALFFIHEQRQEHGLLEPLGIKGVTTTLGLFVDDVDAVMSRAIAAGATLLSPAKDYDYGYRQGELSDPFGHRWLIQKKL